MFPLPASGQVLLASLAIGAEAPEQDAISHLLQFVETSRCTFLRNGVEYNSKSAVKHTNANPTKLTQSEQ
jgi:Family of unknown function (DUF5329)